MVPVFGAILAEWGEHDAVLECGSADSEGLEELRDGAAIGLGIRGCASRRDLCRSIVGDLIAFSDYVSSFWVENRASPFIIEKSGNHEITYALSRPVWDCRPLLFPVLYSKSMMARHLVESTEND